MQENGDCMYCIELNLFNMSYASEVGHDASTLSLQNDGKSAVNLVPLRDRERNVQFQWWWVVRGGGDGPANFYILYTSKGNHDKKSPCVGYVLLIFYHLYDGKQRLKKETDNNKDTADSSRKICFIASVNSCTTPLPVVNPPITR
ncbi:hypothetical protein C5167_018177 [Papaver somniferum]|uniref:Uncharacterized protein n=1 Tax=Papaver somniferum TaxID=3469 RepID=A0A4Y7IM09_PAPSO|nr:hypothetical protein C5167_018177 [Papaver somniferum]